jgi:uncharacterized membrane protein YgcG
VRRALCNRLQFTLVVLVLLLSALPASARSWRITDFRTTAVVHQDGSANFTEHITVVFIGRFQGIYRTIPIEYPGPRGSNYSLFLDVKSITDEDGHSLKFERKRQGAYLNLKIYLPSAEDTTKTVNIIYSSPNAVRYFDNHDEFYWNVTGNDWPVPIDHASALVTFPEQASGSLRAQAFTGVYGSHDQEATSEVQNNSVLFETTNPLPMRGGLTIDVYIPQGILNEPGALTRFGWFLRGNAILFLPLWAFAVMFSLWWYKGKDPNPGLSVAPMYEPPAGMSPAECGSLLDDAVVPRDITSTVIDLAVRGFIKIEEVQEKHLVFTSKDYVFHLLIPQTEWNTVPTAAFASPQAQISPVTQTKSLTPYERVLLDNMFQGGTETRMSYLKNRFYTALPIIKQDIMSALKIKGMYSVDPASAGSYVVMAAIAIAAPFVALQALDIVDFTLATALLIVSIILAAAIVVLFGRQMTARSMKGARTKVAIQGFQEFMNRVDADRLKRMPPDTFEKFLPYAMALGVEHHWALAFKDILHEPPSWYVPYGGYYPGYMFNPIFFTNTMHGMTTDLHDVMVAAPRASSTGSGFGGGGFSSGGGYSGGGFGGGGGGAF